VQHYILTIKLLIDENIEIVLLFFDINGHVDACSLNCYRDRFRVILVLQEKCELLEDIGKFHGDKSKLDLCATVTVNFSGAFETDLGEEFLEKVHL
jgi:hypothetical protein